MKKNIHTTHSTDTATPHNPYGARVSDDSQITCDDLKVGCPTLAPLPKNEKDSSMFLSIAIMVITFLIVILFAFEARSEVSVDMNAIAIIESGLNPKAYNKRSGATGMYQVMTPCVIDYNTSHGTNYTLNEMFDEAKCYEVANWYMQVFIPRYLKKHGIDSLENRLASYNWGIGNVRKYCKGEKKMPKETTDYIRKYKETICNS